MVFYVPWLPWQLQPRITPMHDSCKKKIIEFYTPKQNTPSIWSLRPTPPPDCTVSHQEAADQRVAVSSLGGFTRYGVLDYFHILRSPVKNPVKIRSKFLLN